MREAIRTAAMAEWRELEGGHHSHGLKLSQIDEREATNCIRETAQDNHISEYASTGLLQTFWTFGFFTNELQECSSS